MQSGISASTELHSAFAKFSADSTLFALPVTISSETLQPLPAIPFISSDFKASLPSLSSYLQPKTPIYLILRPSTSANNDLIAITFIPYNAPVRAKTLYASTRESLKRDLGLEKFSETIFATETEEILDPAQWDERVASNERSKNGVDTTLLSTEERELQSVKRAEEEERHGTGGRDLMGEGGSGAQWSGSRQGTNSSGGGGLRMKISDDAREALEALKESANGSQGGHLVQYGIEPSSETLVLLVSAAGVTPGQVAGKIPSDTPTYTFYLFPGTSTVIFIYTCPGASKVRERMVYAASKNGVLEIARGEGVSVKSRLEAGGPEDITELRIMEEAGVSQPQDAPTSTTKPGFARPKRPGKR